MAKEDLHEQDTVEEKPTEEAWREVGRQFEALGESLSRALQAAWESEETQEHVDRLHVQSMQDGLEKMVDRVNQTVREASESQQGRKLRTEAERTAESLRKAGEQTWREAQPQLLSALKKVNAELQRVIDNLEKESASDSEASASPPKETAAKADKD